MNTEWWTRSQTNWPYHLWNRNILEHSICHATCTQVYIRSHVALSSISLHALFSVRLKASVLSEDGVALTSIAFICLRFTFCAVNLLISVLLPTVFTAILRVFNNQRFVHNPPPSPVPLRYQSQPTTLISLYKAFDACARDQQWKN